MEVFWVEQVIGNVPAKDDWLGDREQQVLAALKIPKRRADWRLGRWTAKHAVAAFLKLPSGESSFSAIEIRAAASGAPQAFLRDQPARVSISLSHSNGAALCTVTQAETVVGCDLELIEPRSDAFLADYFTAEEQRIVARSPGEQRDLIVTVLWSAKESALKSLREGLRLDTRAVSAWLECIPSAAALPFSEWSELRVRHENKVFAGWWRCAGRLVRTVVSVPSAVAPISLKNLFAAKS